MELVALLRTLILCVVLASLAGCVSATRISNDEAFEVAITVDDLPVHGPLVTAKSRREIADAHITVLRKHGVKEAFGFVNTAGAEREQSNEAVLAAWRAAGFPLGNHTASHMNLDRAPSLAAWQADVVAAEATIAQHMKDSDWRYLRFPNLAAGSTSERHAGAAAFLATQGYKVAHVSMSFNDWDYNEPYARCVSSGNQSGLAELKRAYLIDVDETISRTKAASRALHHRVIPQVLLIHMGEWSAVTLSEVLERLEKAGAAFVPLAQAQRDPAYRQAEGLRGGGSILDRLVHSRQIDLNKVDRSELKALLRTVCR